MGIVINPGSGRVENANEKEAIINMKHFITDCKIEGLDFVKLEQNRNDGRFSFLVFKGNRCHTVDMPGIQLDKVRYIGWNQNIWNYPILYIDGLSWIWKYALIIIQNYFKPIRR